MKTRKKAVYSVKMATGLENIGISASSFSFGSASTIIQIALPIVVLIGAIIYMVYLFSFDVKINIYNPSITGSMKEFDKGKRALDKKTKTIKEFVLMRYKKDWKGNIPSHFFIPTKKAFGRVGMELNMIRDTDNNLQPIMPPSRADVTSWDGMGPSDIAWALAQIEEGYNTFLKHDWLSKYGGLIIPIVGFIVVGVILLVLFKELEPLAAAFNSAADKIAEAMIMQSSQNIGGVTP
jgi:hypothetical protein